MSKLRIGAAAAAGLTAVAMVGVPSTGVHAATTVGVTGQGVVPGLAPLLVSGAVDTGPATGPVHVVVTMAGQDPSGLAALLASGGHLAKGQFGARYGASPATIAAVTAWLRQAGLFVGGVTPDGLLVDASGPASVVGAAFGTHLDTFVSGALSYYSPTSTASVPAALAGSIVSVLGLSNLGRASSTPAAGVNLGQTWGPQQFWSYYDAPSAYTGAGQTMAILAEGDLTQTQKDLRQFESVYGLPQASWTTRVVDGGSSDTSGADEWDLDTQYSTGFAPGASLLVYDGRSLNDPDIADELSAFESDDAARQGSFSAGECEVLAQVSGFRATADALLAAAQAQGQTLFTSSGDTGAFCPAVVGVNGVPAGIPNVNFPAASPSAIGVGGTSITGLPLAGEIGWYGSGGGPSLLESKPAWQSGPLVPTQRGVPDVALDADPQFVAYNVIVNGTPTGVGGTSAGAPSWNGIWARAQQAHSGSLGFAGPALYGLPASAFRDVIVGSNVLYPAAPGYDYVTGRGVPDIAAVVSGA